MQADPTRRAGRRAASALPLLVVAALAAPLVLPRAHAAAADAAAAPVLGQDDQDDEQTINEELIDRAGSELDDAEWIPLFNGVDLSGWTPKIRTYEYGENFADTFRVEDGLLKVGYEGYGDDFGNRFGHLFWEQPYQHYRLRVEYRFVGEQAPGGPGWAVRNSGVMVHCQDPRTMERDQEFPVSIEAQMLGGLGEGERTTANLCTPGTNVVIDDELVTRHCTNSTSPTYHGEQWVTMDVEVRGDQTIRHWLEGRIVLEYHQPQLDPNDPEARTLLEEREDGVALLRGGYIALQSESAPLEFRRVELLPLDVPPSDRAGEGQPAEGDGGAPR